MVARSETLVDAHRRPVARVEEGIAAALGGASAMIDVSDGLGVDLDRLASASLVGIDLDDLGVNLKPARALGMTTIKVVDPDAALADLEAVVGFPLRDR